MSPLTEDQYGCGYLGLLDRVADRGNRTRRASEASLQLLETVLKEHYATPQAKRAAAVYQLYRSERQRDLEGLPIREAIIGRRHRVLLPAPSLPTEMELDDDDLDLSTVPHYEEYR